MNSCKMLQIRAHSLLTKIFSLNVFAYKLLVNLLKVTSIYGNVNDKHFPFQWVFVILL